LRSARVTSRSRATLRANFGSQNSSRLFGVEAYFVRFQHVEVPRHSPSVSAGGAAALAQEMDRQGCSLPDPHRLVVGTHAARIDRDLCESVTESVLPDRDMPKLITPSVLTDEAPGKSPTNRS
jgi:hypothetical protein